MMNAIKYPFTNSVVFAMVMEDPELCRELIARIFPRRKVKEVRIREKPEVVTEATLIAGIRAKHIRLDVRFEDGSSWYDVELQAASEDALPKRSRYYASAGDVKMLHRGEEYRDLKPSFVIFLCCFDFFGADEPIYEFQRFDRKLDLPLGDESYIIILNSKCSEKKVPKNLQSLFRYINESEVTPGDSFVERVHARVAALQESEEVRNIMTLEEEFRIRINRAEKAAAKAATEAAAEAAETAKKSQERLICLQEKLLDDGRTDDLRRSLHDEAYRAQLFAEYQL